MASAVQRTHRLPCRAVASTWLRALAINRVRGGASRLPLSTDSTKQHDRITCHVATYAESSSRDAFNSTISSGAAKFTQQQRRSPSYSRARGYATSSPEVGRPCTEIDIPLQGCPLDRSNMVRRNSRLRSYNTSRATSAVRASHASSGSSRAFGGQSVVPWELALFLVEEVSEHIGCVWCSFVRFVTSDRLVAVLERLCVVYTTPHNNKYYVTTDFVSCIPSDL